MLDGALVPDGAARQELAAQLGFSETVFVDGDDGRLRIFTPRSELPLAGHPLVGTAWLLAQCGRATDVLRPPGATVSAEANPNGAAIVVDPSASPPWRIQQLASPEAIDACDPAFSDPLARDYVWAWIDEAIGRVRARCFAPALGIPEDEATGSAALLLCGQLGRAIEIVQGRGSVLIADPAPGGLVRLSGRVVAEPRIVVDPL